LFSEPGGLNPQAHFGLICWYKPITTTKEHPMPLILLEALKVVALAVARFVLEHLSKRKPPPGDKAST
jgi:hypothetical protein